MKYNKPEYTKDFLIEVEKGNVAGHSIINKFGANSDVSSTFVPISEGGVYQTPTALTSLELLSDDNVNDKAGGIGALTVEIEGLGAGWLVQTETITLNGTTPVASANQYYRIYRLRVVTSGTYASATSPTHSSEITLRTASAGVTWGKIITDNGFGLSTSEIGAFSIPQGQTAYLLSYHLDVESNKAVDVIMFLREHADDITSPYTGTMQARAIKRSIAGEHWSTPHAPQFIASGPADVGFMARGVSTAKVEVEFQLLCITN